MQLLDAFPTKDNDITGGFQRILPDFFFLIDMVLDFLDDAVQVLHGFC